MHPFSPPSPRRLRLVVPSWTLASHTLASCARASCVLATLLLAACGGRVDNRSGDADLQLRWTLTPDPPRVGTGEIRVEISDVTWQPRNGARVIITGIRDGVELVVDTARGEGAGRYLAPDFSFEVAGSWILRARVETPEGRWTQEDYSVEVVAGEG